MKRILTIVILTLSSVIYGQLQNFNSGAFPPVSPNVITTPVWGGGTYSGDPATWYRSDDPVVNGTMGNNGLDVGYGGSGNCAVLYSNIFDGYNCCGFQVDMIINNINMSAYAVPQMKFYIKHPDGDEQIQIAVSNMGGGYNLLQTISSNYTNWTLVTVDLSAYAGSNDVTIRFRGVEGSSGYSDVTNVGIDEVLIEEQTPMVYMSSTTSHVGCGLKQGYNDQKIMRIDVNTQGSLNPLNLTELMMNTNGSSDDCNDVILKKIYSTGTSSVFNTSNLIGSSYLTGDYTVSGTVTLNDGTNYFWVACDIPSTSTVSNVVDAECTGLVINSVTETPTVTAPAGNLVINNTGVFTVTNLNNSGAGSLRSAISSAYSYGCGDAIVDATGVTGTISWGARFSGGPDHDVKIIGSGADQLIVDGGGADGFLYHYGDGSLSFTGLQVINCAGSEIIYKPGGAGDLVLEDCWFNNNTYRTVYFVNTSGSFSASNCSFSNNSSSTGTMYLPNIAGSVNFSNCTFYNNSSSSTAGVFYAANVQGGLTLNNCTLLNNSSGTGTGGIQSLGGFCTAINTTFENTPKDFTGQITMNYSHMSNTTGATISGANNILNVSANLLAMTNNGGTTPTCAINVGSPLINAGTANIEYDQRGYCRPNTSDIGAHENNGVQDVTAPVPDLAILLDVTDECSVSFLTYPTATENCASTVIVRHDACLPITVQGTTVVTWTYDDGNGNTSTQTQNVVISDVTAPVADVASLTDVTDECSVAALATPTATDNCAGSVTVTNDATLPITAQGTTVVTWTYDDGNGNTSTQAQNVVITDITDPVADVASLTNVTDVCAVAALVAPTATDNCAGSVTVTHNASLPITAQGTTLVTWTYDDGNGNIITQDQNVVITDITDPVADVASLTNVTDECSVAALVAPTATDNCAGSVIGTHNASLPITAQGTTLVTWTYDDGNGNIITQDQNVVITDVSAPVADVASLADVIDECSVAALVAPTATDNCTGSVIGTHNASLPITAQGTTLVTWTYDDGNGYIITQDQNVVITDVSAPVADVASLADVTDECSVAALVAPTSTDNCAGPVTGTHNASLPITAQGTTLVTWTYDDGNGNIITQDQNVVITDVSAPIADVASLADVTECFESTPTAPTAIDNCAGALTATPDISFPIMTAGTTVVTWTYDDGNGNTSTQTQNVIVNTVNVNVTQTGALLTSDVATGTYQWIDCNSSNAIINGETNQSYTPTTVTGNYAVEVTENGCVDTSACYLVDYAGIDDLITTNILVYPNPSNDGYFTVQYEGTISKLVLLDMFGRIIEVPCNIEQGMVNASTLEAGKYILHITANEEVFIEQIVIVK